MRLSGLILGVAITALLAGCAARPNWSKPGTPDRQIEADWSACKADANEAAGVRRYDTDSGGSAQMSTLEAKKRKGDYDRALDACMRTLGYSRAR